MYVNVTWQTQKHNRKKLATLMNHQLKACQRYILLATLRHCSERSLFLLLLLVLHYYCCRIALWQNRIERGNGKQRQKTKKPRRQPTHSRQRAVTPASPLGAGVWLKVLE